MPGTPHSSGGAGLLLSSISCLGGSLLLIFRAAAYNWHRHAAGLCCMLGRFMRGNDNEMILLLQVASRVDTLDAHLRQEQETSIKALEAILADRTVPAS